MDNWLLWVLIIWIILSVATSVGLVGRVRKRSDAVGAVIEGGIMILVILIGTHHL